MGRHNKSKRPQLQGTWRKRVAILAAVVSLAAALAGALLVYFSLGQQSERLTTGHSAPGPTTAAIVDQLSLTFPNPTFVDTATSLLEQAGYAVDHYLGEEVTVEFYRDLPAHGYDLLVLRVHSGMAKDDGVRTNYVSLFTGEPFSEIFHDAETWEDAEAGRLGRARQRDGSPEYFSIVPDFIESSMRGRFEGTTVIMMGCDGLRTDTTAETFVRKGAKAVVGWSGLVSPNHTDAATERLLNHLVTDGLTVEEATAQTMAEVGPDPEYESRLLVYPSKG